MSMEEIEWARAEADRIEASRVPHGAAMDFLINRKATGFVDQAKYIAARSNALRSDGRGGSSLDREMAQLLRNWADYADAGMAVSERFEVRVRFEAATDLMVQVQRLLDDRDVHPAAPIVLCGAALEEFLRGLADRADATVSGRPTLGKYAAALRKAEAIDAQDQKDITAWAGRRNDAAHGHFDRLDRQHATLMADGVNLFMRKRASA